MEPCPSCPCIVSLYSAKSPPPHLLQPTILSFLLFSACSVFPPILYGTCSKLLCCLFCIFLLCISFVRCTPSILRPTLLCLPPYIAFSAPPQKLLEGPQSKCLCFLLCIFSIMYIYLLNSLRSFFCAKISSFKAVQGSTVPVSGQTLRIILCKRDSKKSIEILFAHGVK